VIDLPHTRDEDRPLTEDNAVMLVEVMGSAAASRVPLDVTLAALAEEHDDRRLADVAHRLSTKLQQGATMDEAVASLGERLPSEIGGLLRAGVESGDLAGTFERFAEERLVARRLSRKIRSAIAYPLVILVILVPVALFLSLYVIPMFAQLFKDFDMEYPEITEIMIAGSKQLPEFIGGLLLLVLGVPLVLRFLGGRWLFHRVRAATPILGRLWTWSAQREFSSTLASFLDERLTLPSAVTYTGEVISDRNLGRACRRVTERLESGHPLSHSLDQSIYFDRTLVALVAWGERYGLVPDALRIATEIFADRIEQQASVIHRLLPPVTLIVVGTMAFLLLVSLMVPLVQLIEGLT
jgi:type II secretory pathway component PulF